MIPRPVLLASVVTIFPYNLRNALDLVSRSTSVLFDWILSLVLLPNSIIRSFSTAFSAGPSFPKVSVRILLNIVLRRGLISTVLYYSVVLILVLLRLPLRSVLFRFHQFRVPAISFVSKRIRISIYLHGNRFFRVWIIHKIVSSRVPVYFGMLLLWCHLAMPVYCIPVFGRFFLEKFWVCRQVRKTFFLNLKYPLNFAPVIANTHCLLVSSDNFICPFA